MAIGVGGGDLFDGNADAERCWELEKEIKKLKQQLAEKDARDLTIARLRWENRYLLNRSSVKALVVGDYGKLAPFKDEIVSADEKEKMEDFEREAYIDLGGDVSEWWMYEFKSWVGPYGFHFETVKDGVWNIVSFYKNDKIVVATIDSKAVNGNRFFLRPAVTIDGFALIYEFVEKSWSEIREHLFKWEKQIIEAEIWTHEKK